MNKNIPVILIQIFRSLPIHLRETIADLLYEDLFSEELIPLYLNELSEKRDFQSHRSLLKKAAAEVSSLIH